MLNPPKRNPLKQSDGNTHCWNCDQAYSIQRTHCPKCNNVNAYHNFEAAKLGYQLKLKALAAEEAKKKDDKDPPEPPDPRLDKGYGIMSS